MANTYAVYNSGEIVLEYWSGDVYFDELKTHQLKHQMDSRITVPSCEIIDLRDVNVCLDDAELIQFSEILADHSLVKKVALVTTIGDWDQASLFSKNAWDQNVEVIVFHSLEAACAWVEYDCKHISKKLKQLKQGLMVECEA